MSGGSYNYAFNAIQDFAANLRLTSPERKAFKTLCINVAKAMHDIEWVDSCDNAEGSEAQAIRDALGENADQLILAEAIKEAERAHAELSNAIREAKAVSAVDDPRMFEAALAMQASCNAIPAATTPGGATR